MRISVRSPLFRRPAVLRIALRLGTFCALPAGPLMALQGGTEPVALERLSQPVELPDAPAPAAALLPPSANLPAISTSLQEVALEELPQSAQSAADRAAAEKSDTGNKVPPAHTYPQQPKRILGLMPNYRSVGNDVTPPRPNFRTNFTVATHQALDYSSFLFLGMTSLVAEATNAHPALGKGADGYWAYLWRGFLDKTDNTYLSAFVLPSILHEDTRFYSLGRGSITHRVLYVISRQAVARTYGGRATPNIANLGGKAATQAISRYYYPPSAATFSVLATKFGYAVARDVGFTMFREFYPDMRNAAIRKHDRKVAERQARLQQP